MITATIPQKASTFANRCKTARTHKGLTITQVVEITGVRAGIIADIESGALQRSEVSVQSLKALSDCYNVEYEWLFNNRIAEPKNTFVLCEQGPLPTNQISAATFLNNGAEHLENRASQRDCEDGERSMASTVASFNAMYNTQLTEQQGWMFMVFLKASRAKNGVFVKDDYEDGASYFALAGESASKAAA